MYEKGNLRGYDSFTIASGVGPQTILYHARIDPDTGYVEAGQLILTRLPKHDETGNSFLPNGIDVSMQGNIYTAGAAACCMSHGENTTLSGHVRCVYGKYSSSWHGYTRV